MSAEHPATAILQAGGTAERDSLLPWRVAALLIAAASAGLWMAVAKAWLVFTA